MKQTLYRSLPWHVDVNGRRFRITPYYDRVLRVFDIWADSNILDEDKLAAASRLLVRGRPNVDALNAVFALLFEQHDTTDDKKTFDFMQDSGRIYAAFVQSYGIDLFKMQGKMHWWQFIQLFNALPDNTRMAQVISIRAREIPAPTKYNAAEIDNLRKLKKAVALEMSQEERERRLQASLAQLAEKLYQMAQQE